LQTSTKQQDSKEHTPPTIHITRYRVTGDDDLMSGLRTVETRMLRKEKKMQKEAIPSQKEPKKEVPKKKKQN
jgi:hypothetical protein